MLTPVRIYCSVCVGFASQPTDKVPMNNPRIDDKTLQAVVAIHMSDYANASLMLLVFACLSTLPRCEGFALLVQVIAFMLFTACLLAFLMMRQTVSSRYLFNQYGEYEEEKVRIKGYIASLDQQTKEQVGTQGKLS